MTLNWKWLIWRWGQTAVLLAATTVTGTVTARAGDGTLDPELAGLPRPVAADVEQDGVRLKVYPQQVRLNRQLGFGPDGIPQSSNRTLSVYFTGTVETELPLSGHRDAVVTRVVGPRGQDLPLPRQTGRTGAGVTSQLNGGPGRPVKLSFRLELPEPAGDLRRLAEVHGEVTLLIPEGERRVIRLHPLGDYLGRFLRVTDLDDARFMLRQSADRGPGQIELRYPAALGTRVSELQLLGADGAAQTLRQRGSQRQGGEQVVFYQAQTPGQGTGLIFVYPAERETTVRWVVRDVPLPRADLARPATELAVRTQPVDAAGEALDEMEFEVD